MEGLVSAYVKSAFEGKEDSNKFEQFKDVKACNGCKLSRDANCQKNKISSIVN